jgi:hypothetical protein
MDAPIHLETMDELLGRPSSWSLVSPRQSPVTKWFPGKGLLRSSRSRSTRWTSPTPC